MTERRKLFSSTPRKKLFSTVCEDELIKTVMCRDCGYKFETASSTSKIYCPKCGGTRFNVVSIPESPEVTPEPVKVEEEKVFSRKSLFSNDVFQKEFTEPTTEFEEKLKEYSGKVIDVNDCEKIFSMSAEELIEKNYADVKDGNLVISESAFLIDKLFSKLIISVTKELDLDTTVPTTPKESIIEALSRGGNIGSKGIIMIRKAHMMPQPEEEHIHEVNNDMPEWIEDSGIVGDLKIELGDRDDLGLSEFMDYLNSRYSDAPKGLIDYLISKGIIKIDGNHVEVLK